MQFSAIEAWYRIHTHLPLPRDVSQMHLAPTIVWKHSILHDLESAWWVSVWVTHYFRPVDRAERSVQFTQDKAASFKALFSVSGQYLGSRQTAFDVPWCTLTDINSKTTGTFTGQLLIG